MDPATRQSSEPRAGEHSAAVDLPFPDRAAAGRALARMLVESDALSAAEAPAQPPVVLGIPRGGVPVAAAVAQALGGVLDVMVAHKVGAPGEPELAVGAVATDGTALMEPWAREAGVTDDAAFARAAEAELARARAREQALRAGRPPVPLAGRAVVLVDDGMATGATMTACGGWPTSWSPSRPRPGSARWGSGIGGSTRSTMRRSSESSPRAPAEAAGRPQRLGMTATIWVYPPRSSAVLELPTVVPTRETPPVSSST